MLTSCAEFKDKQFAEGFSVVKDYFIMPLSEERATKISEVYGSG
jgi:hypothetical protein